LTIVLPHWDSVSVWTPRYGGQQDNPFVGFWGTCYHSFLYRIRGYQTKNRKGDYLDSSRSVASDHMFCGWWCILVLFKKDGAFSWDCTQEISDYNSWIWALSHCVLCNLLLLTRCLPFIVQGGNIIVRQNELMQCWDGPTWWLRHGIPTCTLPIRRNRNWSRV
jgi:hypothetical protein